MVKRPESKSQKTLIDLIQDHERAWGTKSYAGRPSLAEMLQAPVVAWWTRPNDDSSPMMASVHDDLDMLNKYAARLLLQTKASVPDRRLLMVYLDQKRAAIRGVKLEIVVLND